MIAYDEFLAGKRLVARPAGITVDAGDIHPSLFGWQRDLVMWALRKGHAALFTTTGTGKTRMQVEWARLTGQRALILAPLAVAEQTVREAEALGVEVTYAREQADVPPVGITITNYERLHLFDPASFGAVVLDESSILKAFSGVTKKALIKAFTDTPYRLCCTATPAPNDTEELCNHADFLGVMSPAEMRSTFFISGDRSRYQAAYRLKRHAERPFYRWLASWAMSLTKPSDLGYPDDGFQLPPLNVVPTFVPVDWTPEGQLFPVGLQGVTQRAEVRRATLGARVAAATELVAGEPDLPWLVWCGLNPEQDAIAKTLGPDCVSIDGRTPLDDRVDLERRWRTGDARVLVTKPAVFGWGMNWQHCNRMVFVGLGDSYEAYFQAIRRCWRFGQASPVTAHIVLSDAERPIWDNVLAKQAKAERLAAGLLEGLREHERAELFAGTSRADDYEPRQVLSLPAWLRRPEDRAKEGAA